jgi:hypothetical protein
MGVADDVNFEFEVSNHVAGVHLYDDSIDLLPKLVPNSFFYRERIGGLGCTSILEAMQRIPDKFDLILKMDIEGSEWDALRKLRVDDLEKFRQIVVEYHWFENLMNDQEYSKMSDVLNKLSKTHLVLNSHPNNCGDTLNIENISFPSVIEVTYLRRSSYVTQNSIESENRLISHLNQPCNPKIPELYLPTIGAYENLNFISDPIGMYSRFSFDALIHERDALIHERDALIHERDALIHERDSLIHSSIWRITAPYRKVRYYMKNRRSRNRGVQN